MRHLSTEELLLHCDAALVPERVDHLDHCARCRTALVDLQAVLFEIEHELRSSTMPEPVQARLAARERLELALYPPIRGNGGFPLQWPVAYALAAVMTFAVAAGYLSTQRRNEPSTPTAATEISARTEIAASLEQPGPSAETLHETVSQPRRDSVETYTAPPVAQLAPPSVVVSPKPADSSAQTLVADGADEDRVLRFQLATVHLEPAAAQPLSATIAQPEVSSTPVAMASLWGSPSIPGVPARDPRNGPPMDRLVSPEALEGVIDGYWILSRSRVWDEDISPEWTPAGLRFRGTVEDNTVRARVTRAIERAAGPSPVSFDLELRRPRQADPQFMTVAFQETVAERPSGGVVRQSLLGHFRDAARRSFQSPRPALLEAELDRFVNDVFRSQTELVSRVYVLNRFLTQIDPAQIAKTSPQAAGRLRSVVDFHLDAVRQLENRIYGRLSEALPRRFWTYRGEHEELPDTAGWRDHGKDLLRDTLQLDANLTALLNGPPATVNAAELDLSCGELLHRIRTRIRRLEDQTRALR